MKKIALMLFVAGLAGCATHAEISVPPLAQMQASKWKGKTFAYEIMYSQPKPGIFSGGEIQALTPLDKAELSIASASTLKKLPDYITRQFPTSSVSDMKDAYDYKLVVEIKAHDKRGPAYADFEGAKSLAKSMLTMGLGSSEYSIIADFDATYRLVNSKGDTVIKKDYQVKDQANHQRSKFESFNSLNDFAGQMLEKHMIVTLNDFFVTASN